MTQIATIQPAPQPAPTIPSFGKENTSQFTPHLEKAVTEIAQITPDTSAEDSNQATIQPASLKPSLTKIAVEKTQLSSNTESPNSIPFMAQSITDTRDLKEPAAEEPLLLSNTMLDDLVHTIVQPFNDTRSIEQTVSMSAQAVSGPGSDELTPASVQQSTVALTVKVPEPLSSVPIPIEIAQWTTPNQTDNNFIMNSGLPSGKESLTNGTVNIEKNPFALTDLPAQKSITIQISDKNLGVPAQQGEIRPHYTPLTAVNLQTGVPTASSEIMNEKPTLLGRDNNFPVISLENRGSKPANQIIALQPLSQNANASPVLSQAMPKPVGTHSSTDPIVVAPQNKTDLSQSVVQKQTIIQGLQQIIDSHNETGTVAIRTSGNDSLTGYQNTVVLRAETVTPEIVKESGKLTDKPGFKIPALRQDMLAQYFEAKLNTRESGDFGQNTQNSEQQTNTGTQQTPIVQQSSPSTLPEQTASFQHMSTLAQETQLNQSQTGVKPVILPSGTVVNEENVIHQVVERFQINNRVNDTKITLQLHPEELGELKIDITLKEGSIKANVVAQSQQAQEIIERNMTKLRNSIEDHGFTIEEILVSSESDTVSDFNFFEQQLSNQRELNQTFTEIRKDNDFEDVLEDAVKQSTDLSTGVNIKA